MSRDLITRFTKRSSLFAACCLFFFARPALATPVTYAYASSDVSGSFTLSSALGDNFSGYVAPSSFTFSDASLSVTSASSLTLDSFFIVTNGTGAITGWNFLFELANGDVLETSCCLNDLALTITNSNACPRRLAMPQGFGQ